jgi:hypothetical protein
LFKIRRGVAVVAAMMIATGTLVLPVSPAHAAMPYCDNISGVYGRWDLYARYLTYAGGGGTPIVNCDMNRINVNGTPGQREAIKQIQWTLNFCYRKALVIDGEYGRKTKEAVSQVQTYLNDTYGAGLAVDGWAGPMTRKAMMHIDINDRCQNVLVFFDGDPWVVYGREYWAYDGP